MFVRVGWNKAELKSSTEHLSWKVSIIYCIAPRPIFWYHLLTMKLTISCVIFLIGLIINVTNGNGLKGTEFWFGYKRNIYNPSYLRVVILSEYTGLAYIEYNDTTRSVELEPWTPATYDIDQTLQGTELLIENKGIMVNATVEVNMFLLNYSPYSSDASAVLPTQLLSTSYIVSAGSRRSYGGQIQIVSPYDNNDVNITLRLESGSLSYQGSTYYSGDDMFLRLDKFDTFVLRSYYPLSGTHLTSSEPISVLYGEEDFYYLWFGHNSEMVLPVQSDSYDFIVPVFEGGSRGNLIIVASKENTSVSVENTTWHLQAAERLEISIDVGLPTAITATKGVFVTLYVLHLPYLYDTFLITIPGVDQYMFQYNFFVFNESNNSSVSIVIPESSNVSMIVMDGDPIDTLHTAYIDINNWNYTICTLSVLPGAHFIAHLTQQRFGLFVYGTGEYNSYGYVPDINIGGCKSNPCHNNGTCQGTISSYVCTCAEGFTSTNCDTGIYAGKYEHKF